MTDLQITYFLSVAETKKISVTAEELHVSSPAISKQISSMEEELGITLFTRSTSGMTLTMVGKILYDYYTNQRQILDNILTKARDSQFIHPNELHISVLPRWDLWEKLSVLRRELAIATSTDEIPSRLECHVCFNPIENGILDDELMDGAICFAEDVFAYTEKKNLDFCEIARIPKVFLFSSSLEISKKPDLSPKDLTGLPMLCISAKECIHAHTECIKLCHSYGLNPNVIFMDSLEDIFLSLGMGDGFFICDSWVTLTKSDAFHTLEVPDTHSVVLAWSKSSTNPGLAALIDLCRNRINWTKKST